MTSADWGSTSMKEALYVQAYSEWLTRVLGETDGEGTSADLLLKQVLLVEEEDDGRVCEPFVVADGVKQLHALVHAVLRGEKEGFTRNIDKKQTIPNNIPSQPQDVSQ